MQKVFFFDHDKTPGLRNKKLLKAFIHELFLKEKTNPEQVTYIFCSDEYLKGINKAFLNHNYYTDVIGFNLATSPKKINAEIYVSVDRVKDNAKTGGVSMKEELHRVIFHGALHFCGYNDKKAKEAVEMKRAENKYLKKYFNL